MPRITCTECGRVGSLPEGTAIPEAVRCPGCKVVFRTDGATLVEGRPGAGPRVVERPRGVDAHGPPAVASKRSRPPMPAAAPPPPMPVVRPHDVVASRACDFCGEAIQAAAKKCRHCGELLDPALRVAEEARRIAMHSSGHAPPIVVNNNVAATASATAIAGGWMRRSLLSRVLRLVALAGLLIIVGSLIGASNPDGQAGTVGMGIAAIGMILLVVGVPIVIIHGVLRWITG